MSSEVKISVIAGAQGGAVAQPFREAADATRNLALEQKKARETAAGPAGGFGGPAAASGGGAGGLMGGMKGLGIGAAALYGAAKLAEGGLDRMTRGLNVLNDPLLTTAQKLQQLQEGIPIIGGVARAWREFTEAIDGTTATFVRNAERLTQHRNEMAALDKFGQVQLAGQGEKFGLEARANAFARAGIAQSLPNAAARTIGGVREFEAAERLLPHQRALMGGQAAVEALAKQEKNAANEVRIARERASAAQVAANEKTEELGRLGRGEQGPGGERQKKAIEKAASELLEAQATARERNNRALQAEGQLRDVVNQKAQAGAQVRQAEIAVLQTRIGLAKEEIGRTRNQFQSFGGMMPGDQMFALNSAKRFKQHGFKGIMPEERNVLRQAGFGEVLDLEALKAGEKDPRAQQLRQLMGLEPADLAAQQQKLAQMQVQADVKVGLNEALLADELAKKLGPIISAVSAIVERQARAATEEARAGRMQQRNAQK